MERFTASSAYDLVKASQAGKRMVEHKISKALETCIRSASSQGQTSLLYTVPTYQFGLPIYDVDHVVRKVGKNLVRKGFRVKLVGQNHLYIEWGPTKQKKKPTSTTTGPIAAPTQAAIDATRRVRFQLAKGGR